MYLEILKALWIFLPAAIANSLPIFAKNYNWLPFLELPLDFGKKYKGSRILGDHKTWRGLILGVLGGIAVAVIQREIALRSGYVEGISIINWHENNPLILGALMGFGALFGDAAKSLVKRRLNIKPGDTFLFFDQIDYIIGALLFLSLKIPINTLPIPTIVLTWMALHVLSTVFAWKIGMKEKAI